MRLPRTGSDTDGGTKAGDRVWPFDNSSLRAGVTMLSPHTGVSLGDDAADGGWSHPLYTVSPGVPGDSSSGLLFAQAHSGISGPALTPGTEAYDPIL